MGSVRSKVYTRAVPGSVTTTTAGSVGEKDSVAVSGVCVVPSRATVLCGHQHCHSIGGEREQFTLSQAEYL